ncbi:hypothetical protein C8R43DRAFT_960622 [Mycena crocata]|nr:hypothetical protein C8R43DRAFT_960622 [Mycena crocata]
MSLLLDGRLVSSASYSGTPQTSVSITFFGSLSRADSNNLLLTTLVPPYGSFSVALPCVVDSTLAHDVVLGVDWAAYLWETLLNLAASQSSPVDSLTLSDSIPSALGGRSYAPIAVTSPRPVSQARVAAVPAPSAATPITIPPPKKSKSKNVKTVKNKNKNPSGNSVREFTFISDPYSHALPAEPFSPFQSLPLHVPATASDIIMRPFEPRFPEIPAGPSHPTSSGNLMDCVDEPHEDLAAVFLSPDPALNIFTADPSRLIKMLAKHHIQRPSNLTISGARHALLTHFLSGSCVGSCDPLLSVGHTCKCLVFCSQYSTQQTMSFAALSVVLSASGDTLPDAHVTILSQCFGWSDDSRGHLVDRLASRRRTLVEKQSVSVSARTVFDNIYDLPRGSLLSLAQSHGLPLSELPTKDLLCDMILRHVSNGRCVAHESYKSHIACSSLRSQFQAPTDATFDDIEDPSIRMQVHILRQVAPVLKIRPLRRLLELHAVSYVESDHVRKLRRLGLGKLRRQSLHLLIHHIDGDRPQPIIRITYQCHNPFTAAYLHAKILKGRAICRIVEPYFESLTAIGVIFGSTHLPVMRAVNNIYGDDVSKDFKEAGEEFEKAFPPIEEQEDWV